MVRSDIQGLYYRACIKGSACGGKRDLYNRSMGSIVELNDTLQISKAQGFPDMLDITTHVKHPFTLKDVAGKVFTFQKKANIRLYHAPPVRNFLVENVNGKWIYWGLVHILEVTHDYQNKMTSGKFVIIHLNTPEEMKQAHHLIDQNPDTAYFG